MTTTRPFADWPKVLPDALPLNAQVVAERLTERAESFVFDGKGYAAVAARPRASTYAAVRAKNRPKITGRGPRGPGLPVKLGPTRPGGGTPPLNSLYSCQVPLHVRGQIDDGLVTMPPSLYSFQLEALAAIQRGHAEHQRILLSLPTGSGKTRVAATYAKEKFLDRGLGVLWVAHTEELLDQAYECFVDILGFKSSEVLRLYAGKERLETNPGARLIFMSNLCRNGPSDVDLLVLDEAHRAAAGTYTEWMSVYKTYRNDGAQVLGLTATPYRMHEGENESLLNFKFSRPAVPLFEKMAYQKSFCDLVRIGRVAPFRQVRVDSNLTFDMRKENGDFAGASLEKLNTPARNRLIFNNWNQNRTKYGKTLIFVGTQEHACLGGTFRQ